MKDGTPVMRRPRRAWPPAARTASAIIATAALAMLAACSGSSSSAGSGGSPNTAESSSSPSAVAYSACMRSHGVPGWPDPTLDSEGRPGFNLLHVHGFDPNSTLIRYTKTSECQRTIQGALPGGVPEIRPRPANG